MIAAQCYCQCLGNITGHAVLWRVDSGIWWVAKAVNNIQGDLHTPSSWLGPFPIHIIEISSTVLLRSATSLHCAEVLISRCTPPLRLHCAWFADLSLAMLLNLINFQYCLSIFRLRRNIVNIVRSTNTATCNYPNCAVSSMSTTSMRSPWSTTPCIFAARYCCLQYLQGEGTHMATCRPSLEDDSLAMHLFHYQPRCFPADSSAYLTRIKYWSR